jgi:hypothetical protein
MNARNALIVCLIVCLIGLATGAPEDFSCDFEDGLRGCGYTTFSGYAIIASYNETANPRLSGPQRDEEGNCSVERELISVITIVVCK